MKACAVKGTNQGLVTTYKTFTSHIYTYMKNGLTFEEKDDVRYSTDNILPCNVLFQQYISTQQWK